MTSRDSFARARSIAVVDVGFGDAGKGAVVDFLTRQTESQLVVRFNGGAQAGHNVVTPEGVHHTFAQWGAGTFAGARTHLAKEALIHPTAALVEAEVLESRGLRNALALLSIDPDARVITPFHQAANRIRELARGHAAHGTCGVGIGETVRDSLEHPNDVLRMKHLRDIGDAPRRLGLLRERLGDVARPAHDDVSRHEAAIFEDPKIARIWLEKARFFASAITLREDARAIAATRAPVIFEGAQGVLLDETFGFHPFTTWSACTFQGADALAIHLGEPPLRVGVTRTYAHRHGPGPLPSFTQDLDAIAPEPHNVDESWQGCFRRGWLDLVLARYARKVLGRVDAMALSHVDRMESAREWKACVAYAIDGARIESLPLPRDLEAASATLTHEIERAAPVFERVDPRSLRTYVRDAFMAPIAIEGRGPSARDFRVVRDDVAEYSYGASA